jgi:hypothetical protein
MQRLWLGDALDFWKRAFLDVLRASSTPSRPVWILPMITGTGWTGAEVDTYAAILGVPTSALLSTAPLVKPTRSSYFAVSKGLRDDVFIDPDTGIATGRISLAHVAPAEVFALLSDDNVAAVYQHRPRGVGGRWLARYRGLLAATGAATVGYESAQAGMLFATKSSAREGGIRRALARRLGAVAVARGAIAGRIL